MRKPAEIRSQEFHEKRNHTYRLEISDWERGEIVGALMDELFRVYANDCRSTLGHDNGNPQNAKRRIERINALIAKLSALKSSEERSPFATDPVTGGLCFKEDLEYWLGNALFKPTPTSFLNRHK